MCDTISSHATKNIISISLDTWVQILDTRANQTTKDIIGIPLDTWVQILNTLNTINKKISNMKTFRKKLF